jgi:hypothetical protein
MGDALTLKLQQKLIYLKRLCYLYIKFTTIKWKDVIIVTEDNQVYLSLWYLGEVKENGKVVDKYPNLSSKSFPVKDIPKKIKEYKLKVREEFKNRHTNERLIRERNNRLK